MLGASNPEPFSLFCFSTIIKLLGCGRDLASWTRRGVPWFQTHMRTFNLSPCCEPLAEIPSPQQAEWTCFSSGFSFPNNSYLCWICFCSSKLLIQSLIYCCHLSCSLCLFGFDCFFKKVYVSFLEFGKGQEIDACLPCS